jgi:hypothetical protein
LWEAFDSGHVAFLPRTAFMVTLGLAGALLGMVSFRLASLIPLTRRGLVDLSRRCSGAAMMTPLDDPAGLGRGGICVERHDAAQLRELPQYALITCGHVPG